MEPLKVFIGFDQVEAVAYHTLVQSIIEHASVPVSITPVKQSLLPMFTRERDVKQSNEFSFTRFLVPYLCNYKGTALFIDCDQMFRTDIKELFDLADSSKAVQVVKHEYTPATLTKFLGSIQYKYPKKNWSSVMLFNCNLCSILTPEYVNEASGLDLHQFRWVTHPEHIGELPVEWNHLVGEYKPNPDAKNVHFTVGGPYFDDYLDCEFASEWFAMYDKMTYCQQIDPAREA